MNNLKIVKHESLRTFWSDYMNEPNMERRCSFFPEDGMILPASDFKVGDRWIFEYESRLETGEKVNVEKEFEVVENDSITHKFKLIETKIKSNAHN